MNSLVRSPLLVLLLPLLACKKDPPAAPDAQVVAGDSNHDESIQPVYPALKGEAPPLALRLCAALMAYPLERKAACCERGPGINLAGECVRNLAGALSSGAVKLEETAVARCEAAIAAQHQGCDWVGALSQPPPPECQGLLVGAQTTGQRCRSSLECAPGLRCQGGGPTDVGRCGPPSPVGGLCGTAVDPLVVYARQDNFELQHPACDQGYCDRNRCQPLVKLGDLCSSNVHCGPGRRCAEQRCVDGDTAAPGGACSGGDCPFGWRCLAGTCQKPKALGEPCTQDQECGGACTQGKCAMRCEALPIILKK